MKQGLTLSERPMVNREMSVSNLTSGANFWGELACISGSIPDSSTSTGLGWTASMGRTAGSIPVHSTNKFEYVTLNIRAD